MSNKKSQHKERKVKGPQCLLRRKVFVTCHLTVTIGCTVMMSRRKINERGERTEEAYVIICTSPYQQAGSFFRGKPSESRKLSSERLQGAEPSAPGCDRPAQSQTADLEPAEEGIKAQISGIPGSSKDQSRGGRRRGGCALLASTTIFSCPDETISGPPNPALRKKKPSTPSQSSRDPPSPSQETKTPCMQGVGDRLRKQGFCAKTCWIRGGQTPKKSMPHTLLSGKGIDVKIFTAHSTRAASTSGALKAGVPLTTIMSAAGWSQSSTFAKFYKKGQGLLRSYCDESH
ncbi:recombinase cre [Plakobranchus ocellatus]|uniref:Recombinase cre n=1 Tax=Plakobranchus ocellatus TaxID=259542 RepID=A0AAV3Y4A7_9GAST|nr:recombinase cre [Plakobranchus ocellatus]